MKVKNEAQYPSKAFLYYVAQLGQEDYKNGIQSGSITIAWVNLQMREWGPHFIVEEDPQPPEDQWPRLDLDLD